MDLSDKPMDKDDQKESIEKHDNTSTEPSTKPLLLPAAGVAEDVRSFFKKFSSKAPSSTFTDLIPSTTTSKPFNAMLGIFKAPATLRETLEERQKLRSSVPSTPEAPIRLRLHGGPTLIHPIKALDVPDHIEGKYKWYILDDSQSLHQIALIESNTYYPSFKDEYKRICVQWIPNSSRKEDASNFAEIGPFAVDSSISDQAERLASGSDTITIRSAVSQSISMALGTELRFVSEAKSPKLRFGLIDVELDVNGSVKVDGREGKQCLVMLAGIKGPMMIVCKSYEQRCVLHLALVMYLMKSKETQEYEEDVVASGSNQADEHAKENETVGCNIKEDLVEENEIIENLKSTQMLLIQKVETLQGERLSSMEKLNGTVAALNSLRHENEALRVRASTSVSRVSELEAQLSSEIHEKSNLMNQVSDLTEKCKALYRTVEQTNASSRDSSLHIKDKLKSLENEISQLKIEKNNAEQQLFHLSSSIEDMEAKHKTESHSHQLLKLDIGDLQDQITSLTHLKESLSKDNELYLEEIKSMKRTISELSDATERKEQNQLDSQDLMNKIKVLRVDRERFRKELSIAENKFLKLSMEMDRMNNEKRSMLQRINERDTEINRLNVEILSMKQNQESSSEKEKSVHSPEEVDSGQPSAPVDGSNLLESLQEKEAIIENLSNEVKALEATLADRSKTIDALSSEKNAISRRLESLQKDFSKLLKSTDKGNSILDQRQVGTERYNVLVSQVKMLTSERDELFKTMEMYKNAFEQQIAVAAVTSQAKQDFSFGDPSLTKRYQDLLCLTQSLSESLGEKDEQIRTLREICLVLEHEKNRLSS